MNPPSPAWRRLLPRSIAGRVALGVSAALVALACAFDWNWCRPVIRRYVMSHSGRDIRFDDLQVHWRDGLDPTIEFRGLTIDNAPWAASREPFIRAGRIAATVSWRSLGSDMTVVNLIELEDAQVDMERRADGLRNWRVTHPDDRGPPHVRVLALDARRSALHLIHRGIGLELDARTAPLPAPETLAAHAAPPLTKRLSFSGTVDGHAFDGDVHVSDVLTFGATPRRFAVRGTARLGALKLDAAGVSDDVHALGDVDLDATLAAEGSGPPWPLPEAVARVRPLVARGRVARENGVLRVQPLDIGVAGGHVRGTLVIDAARTPATLAADLQARQLRIERLSSTLAANGALSGAVDGQASVRTRGDSARALVAAAAGSITLSLAEGATVSKRLDARLGLDGGEWLRTLFDKSARVPVQCAEATLALAGGVATPRRFVFETPGTALAVQGSLNLADETVDATLTPAHKKFALLALDKSIHVEGPWHDVKISLKPPADVSPARCGR